MALSHPYERTWRQEATLRRGRIQAKYLQDNGFSLMFWCSVARRNVYKLLATGRVGAGQASQDRSAATSSNRIDL